MAEPKSTRKSSTIYTQRSTERGRPEKVISEETFKELCSMQCTKEEICNVLNVSTEKLGQWCRKTYKVDFNVISKVFRSEGNVSLRRRQFQNAVSGDTKMLIWLGRNWLSQTDKQGETEDDTPPEPTQIIIQGYDASVNNSDE